MNSRPDHLYYRSNIVKTANGTFAVHYSYLGQDGKRHCTTKRGFKYKKDATKWQQVELPEAVERLENPRYDDEYMTMGRLIAEYMEFTKLRRRGSTFYVKENIIKEKILPYWGNLRVFDIKKSDVRDWQDKMLASRKKDGSLYSSTYLRTVNNQLSAILNYAVQYHDLPNNPVLQIERIGSKTPDEERGFWTLEEYQKFSAAIADQPQYHCAFEILFWCGIRRGELLALTLKDVDLEEGTLNIRNSFSKNEGTNGRTKTKNSMRVVHMPMALTEELRLYINSLYEANETDQLFAISPSTLRAVMDDGTIKADIKRITIHGLRHSHISLLMNYVNCASVMDIAKRAGHKSPDITMIYTHSYSNKDEVIANELDTMMKGEH